MYLGFYKLKEMPFRLAPDPRFMFWTPGHTAALACMRGLQSAGTGCAVITGERGAGKTGLVEYLQYTAPDAAPRLDFPPRTHGEFTEWLQDHAAEHAPGDARTIVCDNAHLFPASMLTALLQSASATRVVLAGEPALESMLGAPEIAAWVGACERYRLPSLTAAEVYAYITHRLTVAGATGARLFDEDACHEVHRETHGNPRLVNALCDAALVVARERELAAVGIAEIRRALEDVGRLVALQADPREARPDAPPPQSAAPGRGVVFARLRLMQGDTLVSERPLETGSMSIGRSADNDLCIESKYVSRHHCRIVTSERRSVLEDVQSTNGLYVNSRRVRRHRMRDGDVVQIGQHRLHYVELRESAAPA